MASENCGMEVPLTWVDGDDGLPGLADGPPERKSNYISEARSR